MLKNINEVIVLKVNCNQDEPNRASITARTYLNDYENSEDDVTTTEPPKSTCFDGYQLDEQQILTKLLEFIESKVVVVHDGGLETHFLNVGCDQFNIERISNTIIDTRKLAQLVYPDSPFYELDYLLLHECKIPVPLDHSYKVALLFFNLQEEAKEKKINIFNTGSVV